MCKCGLCVKEMLIRKAMQDLPEEDRLPPEDNRHGDPMEVIKRYNDAKLKFQTYLAKYKYIYPVYYLGKQTLLAMISLEPQFSNKEIL